jgi:hypothetical protein
MNITKQFQSPTVNTITRPDTPHPYPRMDATITDLHGNTMRAGQAPPLLRRTASGHLYQPNDQVRKGGEIGKRRTIRDMRGKVRDVGDGKVFAGVKKWDGDDVVCGATEDMFKTDNVKAERMGKEDAVYGAAEAEENGCGDEDEDAEHQFWIRGFGGLERGRLDGWEEVDDMWLEIAQESDETLRK